MPRTTPHLTPRLVAVVAAALLTTVGAHAQDPPNAQATSPGVSPGLTQEAIRDTVQSHTQTIRGCYEQALITAPDLGGKITVQFTVEPSGTVSRAHIQHNGLNAEMETCLLADIRTWTFPAHTSKTIITYPFVFQAQAPPPLHFSRDALKQAMRDNQDALSACNAEDTPGKLSISFTVQASGVVSNIASTSDTPELATPDIQTCVQNVITPWRFAPTQDGKDARITYPIIFK